MISLVVPCYNEEGNVENFIASVREELQGLDYEVIFINDGSRDHTREKLDEIVAHSKDAVTAIHFSRNFGKEAGIYAGLQHATGEYTVIIDADLQQPVQVAREMVEFLEDHEDYDGVAAYQDTRKESKLMIWFKKRFYHLMNRLCDVELQENDSDFRCMRRNMVDAILELSEYHRFSKGIFAWVGYKVYFRPYEVQERQAGTSSWGFWKLMKYAIEGMVSFSTKPLRIAVGLGLTTSGMALLYMIVVIVQKLAWGEPVPGYPTIVSLILLLGGLQLTVLGIIGEYLGKIHIEVKNRPVYLVKDIKKSERAEK